MAAETKIDLPIDRLVLWNQNPRHEAVETEANAITRLCRSENIDPLLVDIVRFGLNPAERVIVVPVNEGEPVDENATYIVAEGNRRICALKLLFDPELAPAGLRRRIEDLRKGWDPIETVESVVIVDESRRRHWLQRIHDGAQGGRGRMAWKAEQKTRFTRSGRNVLPQALLDYAQSQGFLEDQDRVGRISHLARLIGNPTLKDTLGLITDDGPEGLRRNRPKAAFDMVLIEILDETKEKKLGPQARSAEISRYAHELQQLPELSAERIFPPARLYEEGKEADPGDGEGKNSNSDEHDELKRPKRPNPPRRKTHLRYDEKVATNLEKLDSEKLSHLYWSIAKVNAELYTPLIAVGVWSFLETLAGLVGAKEKTAFPDFWSKGKISQMGVANGRAASTMHDALTRLAAGGNTTKHHARSAHFDYRQLINDWDVIAPLVKKAVEKVV